MIRVSRLSEAGSIFGWKVLGMNFSVGLIHHDGGDHVRSCLAVFRSELCEFSTCNHNSGRLTDDFYTTLMRYEVYTIPTPFNLLFLLTLS